MRALLLVLAACAGAKDPTSSTDADADTDTDADTDADADTDTDSDADADSDTDADTALACGSVATLGDTALQGMLGVWTGVCTLSPTSPTLEARITLDDTRGWVAGTGALTDGYYVYAFDVRCGEWSGTDYVLHADFGAYRMTVSGPPTGDRWLADALICPQATGTCTPTTYACELSR
ncbi:MAG: hypothetical protein R3F59_08075 [Myxococcota bacterium]